jgi:hypothetical protein
VNNLETQSGSQVSTLTATLQEAAINRAQRVEFRIDDLGQELVQNRGGLVASQQACV